MALKPWFQNGKLLFDNAGKLVFCEDCPCDAPPCLECMSCCIPATLTVTWLDSASFPGFCMTCGPFSFNITYSPTQPATWLMRNDYWHGSGNVGGTTQYFRALCNSPGAPGSILRLEWTTNNTTGWSDGASPSFLMAQLNSCPGGFPDTNPILAESDLVLQTPFCCGGGGFARLRISA
jgi:hypothetical protein